MIKDIIWRTAYNCRNEIYGCQRMTGALVEEAERPETTHERRIQLLFEAQDLKRRAGTMLRVLEILGGLTNGSK